MSHLEAGQLLRGHLAEIIAQAQLPRVPAAPEVEVPVLGDRAGVVLPAHDAGYGHAAQPGHRCEALAVQAPPCAQLPEAIVACTGTSPGQRSSCPQGLAHSARRTGQQSAETSAVGSWLCDSRGQECLERASLDQIEGCSLTPSQCLHYHSEGRQSARTLEGRPQTCSSCQEAGGRVDEDEGVHRSQRKLHCTRLPPAMLPAGRLQRPLQRCILLQQVHLPRCTQLLLWP